MNLTYLVKLGKKSTNFPQGALDHGGIIFLCRHSGAFWRADLARCYTGERRPTYSAWHGRTYGTLRSLCTPYGRSWHQRLCQRPSWAWHTGGPQPRTPRASWLASSLAAHFGGARLDPRTTPTHMSPHLVG